MSYFYNPDNKYFYESNIEYFPNDIALTDEYAEQFLSLTDEAKQLIQIGKNGLPIIAVAQPNPFYKWDQDKEIWVFNEDVKKLTIATFITKSSRKLDSLKTSALIDSNLFNNEEGNRTKVQYLYYASEKYINNNADVDEVLALYAFQKGKPLNEIAKNIIDKYKTLNLTLIACDWYKKHLETKFNSLGDEYSDYEKYLNTIQNLTCADVLKDALEAKKQAN